MTFKQALRIIGFTLVLGVACYFLCDVFETKNGYMSKGYASLKNFEEDTIDAVFVGTSGVNRSWIAVEGYDMYGMTVATLSTDALPCWITLDMIKEVYRFQNPKLIILDMRMFSTYDPSKEPDLSKTRSRRAIDTLDFFSINRLDAINRTLKLVSSFDSETSRYDPSFFFSFIQFHEMWNEDDFEIFSEIGSSTATYLGFYVNRKKSLTAEPQKKSKWSEKYSELSDISVESVKEIVEYSEKNDIELLFVDTPHILTSTDSKRNNSLKKLLDELGQKYILYTDEEYYLTDEDYELMEEGLFDPEDSELKLDWLTDFYDINHLNFYGAEKFTEMFAAYLNENYDLDDHTDDERCSEWVGKYDRLKKLIVKYEGAKASE